MTAQWSDDFHHALHALLTGEGQGYYGDFAGDAVRGAGADADRRVLPRGRPCRRSAVRTGGAPVDRCAVPGWRFLGYLQTHDQVGNRAVGDRLGCGSVAAGWLGSAAALVLTSPFTPMLFMGEEWAASTPWQYFTSHEEPELAEAVREGRRREFAAHGWASEDVPDPQAPATVAASTLDWSESVSAETHSAMLDVVPVPDRAAPGRAVAVGPAAGPGVGGVRRRGAVGGGDPRAAAGGVQPGCRVCRRCRWTAVSTSVLLSSSPGVAVAGFVPASSCPASRWRSSAWQARRLSGCDRSRILRRAARRPGHRRPRPPRRARPPADRLPVHHR